MDGLVEVMIPVEPDAAAALNDPNKRRMIGEIVSRMLRTPSAEPVMMAIDRIKAEAHAKGLTDAMIDAELAAHKAERRAKRASGG